MPINQRDTSGKIIRFDSIQAKVLIIDFWASWCGPCREEHPQLKALHEKYHPLGLEILAVSMDKLKKNWTSAIIEDGLPWIQISDLNGNRNEAALRYGVEAIPTNYLLNAHKIIIAKRLRGGKLVEQLEELFGE
jgi:thiol-disulfide isomerase/thioredoxin